MAENNLYKRDLKGFLLTPVDDEGNTDPQVNYWDSWANNNLREKSKVQESEYFGHKLVVADRDYLGALSPTIALKGIPFSRDDLQSILTLLDETRNTKDLAIVLYGKDMAAGRIPPAGFIDPNGGKGWINTELGITTVPVPNLHQRLNPFTTHLRSLWEYLENTVDFEDYKEHYLKVREPPEYPPSTYTNPPEFIYNIPRTIEESSFGWHGGMIPYHRNGNGGSTDDREWHPVYYLMINEELGLTWEEWREGLYPIHQEREALGEMEVSRRIVRFIMDLLPVEAGEPDFDAELHLIGTAQTKDAIGQIKEIWELLEQYPFEWLALQREVRSLLREDCNFELVISDKRRSLDHQGLQLFHGDGKYKLTNFSLQVPLVEDSCHIKEYSDRLETGLSTATADGHYRLYVDPSIKYPPDYPNPPEFWDHPSRRESWDTILEYERTSTPNTYYGDLSTKTPGAFPRYADMTVPTYQAADFVSSFEGLNPETTMYPIMFRIINGRFADRQKFHFVYNYMQERPGARPRADLTETFRQVSNYDLERLLSDSDMGIQENQEEGEEQSQNPHCPPFVERLRMALSEQVTGNVINNLVNEYTSHPYGLFLGMLSGEISYTEPLFYKITRNLIPKPGQFASHGHLMVRDGVPILGAQPIFNTNKMNSSDFTFQDRFVDYSDTYQYDIEAFAAVMKMSYSTKEMRSRNIAAQLFKAHGGGGREGGDYAQRIWLKIKEEFDYDPETDWRENIRFEWVCTKAGFDLVRLPYIHSDLRQEDWMKGVAYPPILITDLPPIPPGVSIIPYRGIEDKMLFMFDLQTDRLLDRYIYLNEEERAHFEGIRDQQSTCSSDDMIEFQSEGEDIDKFQVFRTTIVPEAVVSENQSLMYQKAFGDEPYKEISKDIGSAFVDDIVPNTKYFYMFRVTDKNGHISNPSPIYRVEMVSEDGLIFPIIELYTPKKPKKGTKYRKFAKYLELKPSLLMAEPNWSANDENEIGWKIGSREEELFGRRFLIRLTSIDTGRKMDVQVKFKKKEEQVERNEEGDLGE